MMHRPPGHPLAHGRAGPRSSELEARADRLRGDGNPGAAAEMYLASATAAGSDPVLLEVAVALERGALPAAEGRLRTLLKARPTSIAAIRLMAMLALRIGRQDEAITLLSRALDLAPGYAPAREMRARTLQRLNRFEASLRDVEWLRRSDPADPSVAMLNAALLVRLGRQADAATLYGETLASHPDSVAGWLSYGHVLKAVGRVDDAVAAYRRAIALRPGFGEAWWSLANLKTFAFDETDLSGMDAALHAVASEEDRLHLHFALGKGREDRKDADEAFRHYAAGNAIRRSQLDYRAAETSHHVDTMISAFAGTTAPRLERAGAGPIFIVGLPRSGSTLIEQILASHPAIEGTSELPDMMMIADRLSHRAEQQQVDMATLIADLSEDERRVLGEEYLAGAAAHRQEDKPFFIDKMPNNWKHLWLIERILPSARVIDARRHPMAVGWSAYKQHFSRGQEFTYDLGDIGSYYSDYARYLSAYDTARPGRVYRIFYEHLVENLAAEVSGLLEWLGLPLDKACLSFWTNTRTVRTPSSEQVRRPVFTDAVDHWRSYERWLHPLRVNLGDNEDYYNSQIKNYKIRMGRERHNVKGA